MFYLLTDLQVAKVGCDLAFLLFSAAQKGKNRQIASLARVDCIYSSKMINIYTRHCANFGGLFVSQLKARIE